MEMIGVLAAFLFGVPLAAVLAISIDPFSVVIAIASIYTLVQCWKLHKERQRKKIERFFPGGKIRYY